MGTVRRPLTSHSSVIKVPGVRPPYLYPTLIERGYYAMFSLGRIVFAVCGWELGFAGPIPNKPNPAESIPGGMLPIWPASVSPVTWPPNHQLSVQDIARITSSEPEWA